MSDASLSTIYVTLFLVIGAVIAVATVNRARTAQARANSEQTQQYRELLERVTSSQEHAADALARLTERVASMEAMLKDVG